MPDEPTREEQPDDEHLAAAFQKSVDEGRARLGRTWPGLLATGFVGGVDVGLGVLGLLVVEHATGSPMLGALAFTIGFVALALARSELFTENYLVPVAAVVAKKASVGSLLRLWIGTAVMNLLGGWVFTALIIAGLPELGDTAIEIGRFYPDLGIGWRSFALGLVAGVAITIMTWMQQGSETELGRVVAAIAVAFLLAAVPLNHVIVVSLEMFAALHAGAPFGYGDWLAIAGWATLANMIGGLGLVTIVRFVQVGTRQIEQERRRPADTPREDEEAEESGE